MIVKCKQDCHETGIDFKKDLIYNVAFKKGKFALEVEIPDATPPYSETGWVQVRFEFLKENFEEIRL